MKIYRASTEDDEEGRSTRLLGYFTGEQCDIEQFLQGEKFYNIFLDEIKINHASPEINIRKAELLKKKQEIETELKEIG